MRKRKFKEPKNKKIKFIKCDEFSQTYQWHKTNKGDKTKSIK
tara:strand:- start:215 stop:340 length:126 start_codon:yes stop_codon:yes gene_type:complete